MTDPIQFSSKAACPKCGTEAVSQDHEHCCRLVHGNSQEEILASCIYPDIMKKAIETPDDEDVKDPCEECEQFIIVENDPGTCIDRETKTDGPTIQFLEIHRCRRCGALFKFRVE